MNRNVSHEIIKFINDLNLTKGPDYRLTYGVIVNYFANSGLDGNRIRLELLRLRDEGKIEMPGGNNFFDSPMRLTALGFLDLDHWYKKFWRWFNDDFAKLLSTIAIILSIIATIISVWNR